ncbi:MAG: 30S ribosomal protein S3 [Nitrosopumilus sp.]|nr:30S ribosomal protein S3 [Nitrosopumilus sp.]
MSAIKNVIKDNYNMMLLKDYLRDAIKDAGFSHAEISKTPTGTRVALHVTRPGIVIGRKGTGIRALTEKLETDFGLKSPQISVVEIEKPELAPSVMCNRMASHIERGTAFRRATMWTLKQIMKGGAMGVQITISGKLRGDRSAFEKHTVGILPRAGHHAEIIVDEDIAHVKTAMGLIGIRIRIARKEKLIPEFEMRDKKPKKVKQVQEEKTVKTSDEAAKTSDEAAKTSDEAAKTSDEAAKTSDEAAKTSDEAAKTSDEAVSKVKSETEQIVIEEEKMKSIETLEEEEAKLK